MYPYLMTNLYQIDAFSSRLFAGNPAAVIPLNEWLDDDTLQAIAEENNLSETAFFVPLSDGSADFHLRWFTPVAEVDLCGHATLAAAHALWRHEHYERNTIAFKTRSGILTASRKIDLYSLDFPALDATPTAVTGAIVEALGVRPNELYTGRDLMAVLDNKRLVHECAPNFRVLAQLEGVRAIIVTAPGSSHDFVSRVFAPALGIDEDPVTGSAHCMMAPYWAKMLGKNTLTAHQVSKRGGDLECTFDPDANRVKLTGHAVTYLEGSIHLPQ